MSSIVQPSATARLRAIALALALAAALLPGSAGAWGPSDGSYQVTLTTEGVPYIIYLMVIQDGPNIGVAFLAPSCSDNTIACISPTWNYGEGQPTGVPNEWQGQTLAANGQPVGSFILQFSGDLVTGTTSTTGYPDSSVSGFRLWGGNPAQ
jgi:hypothetical protein